MMLNLLFTIFIGVVVIQMIYYVVIFGRFSFSNPKETHPKKIPVSVIVCAKNEAENVAKNIPLLIQQNYPEFEIVLIDDSSSDNTLEIFEEFEKKHTTIKLVKVKNNEAFWGNKKYALTLGIKAAKHDYLIFTDANCYPESDNWLQEMSAHFTLKKTIVLGYSAYEKIPHSFFNKMVRFDALLLATQYFSWAKIGKPFMGIGRNLAYKKEAFFNVNGFIDHMKIRSGDDDLFINQAANTSNTTCCFSKNSFTYSPPKTTFKEWSVQKRKQLSTASYYKFFDRFQLFVFASSQLAFFILAIILLIFQHYWIAVLVICALRYLLSWISLGYAATKLKETDVIYWYPFLELILLATHLHLSFRNLFSKPIHWK